MIKHYFTIAIRHLVRHKFFSAINILCLAIGITFSLFIGVYVFNQYNVNRSLKNVSNQYIIKSDWKVKEMGLDIATFGSLAKTLKEEYPSLVANYYRYNPVTNVVSAGDKHFKEDIAIGDTSLISMYGFPVLYGKKEQAFINNSSAVITETMANKLFGKTDVVGKVISVLALNNEEQFYKVSAVIKDIPYNSVTNLVGDIYNVFVPTIGNRYYGGGDPAEGWKNGAYEVSMVELRQGVSPKDIAVPIKQILKKYTPKNIQDNLTVQLAPVKKYYLADHSNAVLKMIFSLSVVAAFILLMAIINFININIGTSAYRLKEIGLRKVFGGEKKQLIIQFITEAIMLTTVAAIISLALYETLRSVFGQVLNTNFESIFRFNTPSIFYFIAMIAITGFIAGIYPAFVLSALNVVNAVKGKINTAKGGSFLRKSMLVIQFSLALIVLISALTVSKQVSYIFSKDIGYNKDQVMVITAFPKQWDSIGLNRMMNIRTAMMEIPAVKSASVSFEIPDRKPPGSIDMQPANGDGKTVLITSFGADENYASTFGLKLLAGNFFTQSGGFIPNQIVLNESAVKAWGLSDQSAVNTQIKIPSSGTILTVAGVIKDYNYSSLQNNIDPVAFFSVRDAKSYRYLSLKLNTDNIAQTMDIVKNKWKTLSPNAPFDFTFMDQKFKSLYQTELQLKKASYAATTLALIIVLLGVIGLIALSIQKRVKEIAVRKVLGSSVVGIVALFIREFVTVIVTGGLIACPLAYIIMNDWLQGYAYRINMTAAPFVISILCLGSVTALLICIQTIKTAIANPVKSLRTE